MEDKNINLKTGLIHKKIPAIMKDIVAVGKEGKNEKQGWRFRKIDDVYNMIHGILAKHEVFTVPNVKHVETMERKTAAGGLMIQRSITVEYFIYASDGSYVTSVVVGEGMDSGDKAGNKALSGAHKYLLLQLFCIPTEDLKDSENESPEIVGEQTEHCLESVIVTQTPPPYHPTDPDEAPVLAGYEALKLLLRDEGAPLGSEQVALLLAKVETIKDNPLAIKALGDNVRAQIKAKGAT